MELCPARCCQKCIGDNTYGTCSASSPAIHKESRTHCSTVQECIDKLAEMMVSNHNKEEINKIRKEIDANSQKTIKYLGINIPTNLERL